VRRLAYGVTVTHLPAALAVLAGRSCAAEVARPDECQHLDGLCTTAVGGPLAPQRHLRCVCIHAFAQEKQPASAV